MIIQLRVYAVRSFLNDLSLCIIRFVLFSVSSSGLNFTQNEHLQLGIFQKTHENATAVHVRRTVALLNSSEDYVLKPDYPSELFGD